MTDSSHKADPLAEARRVLAEDEERRMQECAAEIEAVLARHGFRMETTRPQIVLTPTLPPTRDA